jgi:hypothetical protein
MKAAEVAIVDDATAAQLEKIVDEQVKQNTLLDGQKFNSRWA